MLLILNLVLDVGLLKLSVAGNCTPSFNRTEHVYGSTCFVNHQPPHRVPGTKSNGKVNQKASSGR